MSPGLLIDTLAYQPKEFEAAILNFDCKRARIKLTSKIIFLVFCLCMPRQRA